MSLLASNAFATVDSHDKVYLVVKNIQSEEFFVERAPIIGCYGLARGPQLVQFTAEYKVNSNIGCGGETFQDNINYLTCAKITDSKESADYMSFSEITLDISKCEDKSNPNLITMIRTAAKLNFPLKKGEVKLNIIK
jgi:phage anti-repressor protein